MIYFFAILAVAIIAFSCRYNWWRIPQGWDKARVLMYHSISEHKGDKFDKWRVRPADFEAQIAWLAKNGFTTFTLSELANLAQIPPKSVCITFDDGFMDNYTNAFEILKKYNFKATIFVVATATQNDWERGNTEHLSQILTSDEINLMHRSNLIEFGSHTLSHANLERLWASEPEKARDEIEKSKKELEKITGRECRVFAYPYGKFNDEILSFTRSVGYCAAVVVKRGLYEAGDDKFAIKRIGVLGTESFFDFWLKFTRIRNKL
ncbi:MULTISPECIES: polysaccharide deacetylase family protein [unclassified Campylobacter]|uniref:polysaccharide deacetylase family protein n=1 Tax=unclassified Campylobacter TaxID=2593542 RepID=UPI0022E9CFB9|nr:MULTISPECIES: polysaccharide deacetylase family protein [unclassified Campylobacter]MDA3053865.1 polysaccharide deacetylase family protein [Campylobacter sp. VBCF_07 NA4]MDA3060246.1 polysaccharide deacetylase family protein [Campylobacter sp. VBCF_02 NA5]MDA3069762.1 polysaccharide deacetylase family protein [Campylobacter sp. VBCF_08 NA3]WBR54908.1 polysaccharide deacetylase family protein [Campylobacter sp. VBCF_01 NA2]